MYSAKQYAVAETKRIEFLRQLNILDTKNEEIFDNLTSLVASLLHVPIVMISLVDENRQWFKSVVGLDVCETSRDVSFCQYIVQDGHTLMIEDATQDPRFNDNPMVTGEPYICSYMGIPIRPDGHFVVGTLCVVDRVPREFSGDELSLLAAFALQVEGLLRAHQRHMALQFRYKRLQTDKEHIEMHAQVYRLMALALGDGRITLNARGKIEKLSPGMATYFDDNIEGLSVAQVLDRYAV